MTVETFMDRQRSGSSIGYDDPNSRLTMEARGLGWIRVGYADEILTLSTVPFKEPHL